MASKVGGDTAAGAPLSLFPLVFVNGATQNLINPYGAGGREGEEALAGILPFERRTNVGRVTTDKAMKRRLKIIWR